ncbi:MAG TPA: CzcE family metal-binding protein [Rhodocyclaceae bacterium]|nr:CzcE family metal-binding protein [Rhodocyclaceae bacterium]
MNTTLINRSAIAGLLVLGLVAGGQAVAAAKMPYGSMANGTPGRSIVIDNGTRHIDVERFETVSLRIGDQTTNWTFDTLRTGSFPLSEIVPAANGVRVYVRESSLYHGGN